MTHLKTLDWDKIITWIASFTQSDITKSAIAKIAPTTTPSTAEAEMKACIDALSYVSPHRPIIESLDLVPLWLPRLKKGATLSAKDLKDVKIFFHEIEGLFNILSSPSTKWGNTTLKQLSSFQDEIIKIEKTIDSDGNILSSASSLLANLHSEKAQLSKNIHDRLKQILHDYQMEPILQDKFVTTREGRWVVPVKYGMQGRFPGIIHDVSNTGQSLFIEPQEVVNSNNKLREIDIAIQAEIERILKDISQMLVKRSDDLDQNFLLVKQVDLRFALATFSMLTDAKAISFSETELYLVQLRNPILVLQKKEVVSNTIELDAKNTVLLVSGPNAGGKTILLKSIGLAAQLARCGIPVSCEESSRLPFFSTIHTSVGDSQNIKDGLSTFAAHMVELNESLEAKPYRDLVLIDEICGSTDPEEGSALARAFLEHYGKTKVFTITTSHLSPLKVNWPKDSGVVTASMDYDETIGAPTYKLITGLSGSSFAWKTAQKIGVNSKILERAREFMSEEWKHRTKQIDEIESLKTGVLSEKKQFQIEQENLRQQKLKYESLLENFEKEKEQKFEELTRLANKRLEQTFEEIKQGSKKSALEWKVDLPQIIKGKIEKDISAQDFARLYPPGTNVFIQTLGRAGVVQSSPNSKEEVSVLSNSIRLNIHYKYLIPKQLSQKTKTEATSTPSKLAAEDFTLDVRGMTLEEAMERLESTIDQALKEQADRIKVIHGHGTNTLKKAIRAYSSRSALVRKWQAGAPDQGGDGITWVEV